MFSRFAEMYQDMAFSEGKSRHARAAALRLSEDVMAEYLQGREKLYAVRQVAEELAALFGAGAVLPLKLIDEALALPDEEKRAGLIARALHMLERQVRAEASSAYERI